jgi:hypothetical protein
MKRTLTFCYLVFLITVLIPIVSSSRSEPDSPFWLVTLGIFSFGLVAISIVLHGLSYKPKSFTWLWKIIPFLLIAFAVLSWYWEFILYPKPESQLSKTVLLTLFGVVVLLPAFYLSFKFGYSNIISFNKPNLKFSLKSIAVISIVLILCVISHFTPNTKDRINVKINYVAKYNEISKPAGYDPNNNAAPYYQKAFDLITVIPDIKGFPLKKWPGDMNDAEFERAKDLTESSSQIIEYLTEASQKPYYWIEHRAKDNNLFEIMLPDLKNIRFCVQLLTLKAKLLAYQGQTESALKLVSTSYKIGTHFGQRKTLIEQLVGIGIRMAALNTGFQILDETEISPKLLENFQHQIEEISRTRDSVIDFTSERMMFYDKVQRLFTDDGQGNGHVYGTAFLEDPAFYVQRSFKPELSRQPKITRKETVELANKMYDYFDRASGKLPAELNKEHEDPDKIAAEMVKGNYLLETFAPAWGQILKTSYRLQAYTNGLLTTVALLRYKTDKGEYPQSLDELVASGYLNELPIDPFSGGPLVYKLANSDFILYSFAADCDDDNGIRDSKDGNGDYVFWPVERSKK